MDKRPSVRNGKIEFLRFLFCIIILLFHGQKYLIGETPLPKDIRLVFFRHGAIGVEFFFLVSGYLMAKTIYKTRTADRENGMTEQTLSKNALMFIKKKYISILPQHLAAFVIVFIAYVISNGFTVKEWILKAINSLPNLFLIEMSGLSFTNPNHIEWYISSMLIAMAILYPFCYKYYYTFTRYAAPLISLLIVGYLIYETKYLSGVTVWMGFSYKGMLRAVAEIALGTTAFEISRYMNQRTFSKAQRFAFTVLELSCLSGILIYCVTTFSSRYESYALIAIFVLVTLAFSGVSYGSRLFDNKLCYFLGNISLPVYLAQLAPIYVVPVFFPYSSGMEQILYAVILTFVLTFVIMAMGNLTAKTFKKLGIK